VADDVLEPVSCLFGLSGASSRMTVSSAQFGIINAIGNDYLCRLRSTFLSHPSFRTARGYS